MNPTEWSKKIQNGDKLALSKAITEIESDTSIGHDILASSFQFTGNAQTIGFTGSAGAGKSTLVRAVIKEQIARGKKTAVIAIDPSSPFSQGAILGDRIRMQDLTNNELVLCPTDYPYLYTKINPTNVFLGAAKHWRSIDETLCTFLTSKKMLEKHWDKLVSMCKFEHYPFEQPLHEIYKSEYCLSPIPSIALHCTNVNSIFGLSPNMDWQKVWEDNKNY